MLRASVLSFLWQLQEPLEVGSLIIPIWQMRRLSGKERSNAWVAKRDQGHTAVRLQSPSMQWESNKHQVIPLTNSHPDPPTEQWQRVKELVSTHLVCTETLWHRCHYIFPLASRHASSYSLCFMELHNYCFLINWRLVATLHQESPSPPFFQRPLLTVCLCITFWFDSCNISNFIIIFVWLSVIFGVTIVTVWGYQELCPYVTTSLIYKHVFWLPLLPAIPRLSSSPQASLFPKTQQHWNEANR